MKFDAALQRVVEQAMRAASSTCFAEGHGAEADAADAQLAAAESGALHGVVEGWIAKGAVCRTARLPPAEWRRAQCPKSRSASPLTRQMRHSGSNVAPMRS